MDVAITLVHLRPNDKWHGSVTGNTEKEYDAIRWIGPGKKPTWAEIQAASGEAWAAYEAGKSPSIEARIAKLESDALTVKESR